MDLQKDELEELEIELIKMGFEPKEIKAIKELGGAKTKDEYIDNIKHELICWGK